MNLYIKSQKATSPYVMERSVMPDGESELLLTPTAEPEEEIETILDAFAREYMEDV